MGTDKVDKRLLGPVLAGFFIMGFCDMVAPITGRIAAELPPDRQQLVSFLPTMVFLWFLVLSLPIAAVMNRIGRKATALAGYAFTVVGLTAPMRPGRDALRCGTLSVSACWASAIRPSRWPSIRCWPPAFPSRA